MMNMIMEKNFTWLYYKHEAYLDRVYIQQINEWLQEGMRVTIGNEGLLDF